MRTGRSPTPTARRHDGRGLRPRPSARRRERRLHCLTSLLLVLLVLLFVGSMASACAGVTSSRPLLSWDLSQHHRISDVGWPDPSLDDVEFSDVTVHLTLASHKVFQGAMREVFCSRADTSSIDLSEIDLNSEPLTLDAAYQHAKALGTYWGFDAHFFQALDAWYGNSGGSRDRDPYFELGMAAAPGISSVPGLRIHLLDSFDDQRPWMLQFSIFWST